MSWAFIKSMKEYPGQSYVQILQRTRALLSPRYSQIPQLSVRPSCQPLFRGWELINIHYQVGAQFNLDQPVAF